MNTRALFMCIIGALPGILAAQTTHFVQVGGSTLGPTLPYYAPNVLQIQVGDMVTWNNVGGTHNVNADLAFFPTNPEGFVNGSPSNQSWNYSRTFTIPGTYNYMCSTEGHSATQTGRIFVVSANAVGEQKPEASFTLSPSVASDHLLLGIGEDLISRAEILGLDGRQLAVYGSNAGPTVRIPVDALPAGNYLLRVQAASGRSTTLRFSKQ